MKKYKKEVIDIKKLDEITPSNLRGKINLLFNKDIPKNPNTANERIIERLSKVSESHLQQHFYKEFNLLACEAKFKNKDLELEFVQNDNGDTAGGSLTQIQRIALYKRKKVEGSKAGYPDISIIATGGNTIYCEVKKITTPSAIHLTKEQFDWFLKLNRMGFDAYITNNPTFFKEVILEKVKNNLYD